MKLNEEQELAVSSDDKNIFVKAGPGSGKTRTLIAAIGKQLKNPECKSVVAISFTVASAREIRTRLVEEFGESISKKLLYCGTVHGWMFSLLRTHGYVLGFDTKTLSIADDQTVIDVAESIAHEMKLKCPRKDLESLLKSSDFIHPLVPTRLRKCESLAYQTHRSLRKSGMLSYESILYLGCRLLYEVQQNDSPISIGALFWDEFQDSGVADLNILLAADSDLKFVVGDSNQSIYSFRGGDPSLFESLGEKHGFTKFVLKKNYRSGYTICDAATHLISNNGDKDGTDPVRQEPGQISFQGFRTGDEEMMWLRNEIFTSIKSGTKESDIAVLCRTNRMVNEVKKQLQMSGVLTQEKYDFVTPKDWALTKALISVFCSSWNDHAAYTAISLKESIITANKFRSLCRAKFASMWEEYAGDSSEVFLDDLSGALKKHGISLESVSLVENFIAVLLESNPGASVADLLVELCKGYGSVKVDEKPNCVTVSTVHSAKGLEYDTVYVVGCEEGVFPMLKGASIEEERRLFFVAMTRAKNNLILSGAYMRYVQYNPKCPVVEKESIPSRFLSESKLTA